MGAAIIGINWLNTEPVRAVNMFLKKADFFRFKKYFKDLV
jgi:hypothetical protein